MKKPYAIIIFLIAIFIVLSVGKALLQNMLSTSGIFVSRAEQEVNYYKTQNAVLSEELLAASSLATIAEKAQVFGFTNENSLMVLKASRSLAVKP